MALNHIQHFEHPASDQAQSKFFTDLPPEIRTIIYEYVFTDYEDLDDPYPFDTCYRRPGYFGPRRSHTAFLQTCQEIYTDCWYMPWMLSQQTFYLAWGGRRPERTNDTHRLRSKLVYINRVHSDAPPRRKEIASTQIFAQLCNLEGGSSLSEILDTEYFKPRSVTVTVRHTDIWSWESDAPISMYGSQWVWQCRFPDSVTNVTFQLESLDRKRDQVDDVMNQIQRGWFFTRKDGVVLAPDVRGHEVESWMGSSTWEGMQWTRDEEPGEEGKIKYYLASLRFSPVNPEDKKRLAKMENNANRGGMRATKPYKRRNRHGVDVEVGVDDYDDDTDEYMVDEYEEDQEDQEEDDDDDDDDDDDGDPSYHTDSNHEDDD